MEEILIRFLIGGVVVSFPPWLVTAGATMAWMAACALLWRIRKHNWRSSRLLHHRSVSQKPPAP